MRRNVLLGAVGLGSLAFVLAGCAAVSVEVKNDCWLSQFPFVKGVRVDIALSKGLFEAEGDSVLLDFGQTKEFFYFTVDEEEKFYTHEIEATLETFLPDVGDVTLGGLLGIPIPLEGTTITIAVSELDKRGICLKGP